MLTTNPSSCLIWRFTISNEQVQQSSSSTPNFSLQKKTGSISVTSSTPCTFPEPASICHLKIIHHWVVVHLNYTWPPTCRSHLLFTSFCVSARFTPPPLTLGLFQTMFLTLFDLCPSSLKPRDSTVAGKVSSSNRLFLWRHSCLSVL